GFPAEAVLAGPQRELLLLRGADRAVDPTQVTNLGPVMGVLVRGECGRRRREIRRRLGDVERVRRDEDQLVVDRRSWRDRLEDAGSGGGLDPDGAVEDVVVGA